MLWKPPAGVDSEVIAALPEWDQDNMANQFMAQLAMRGDNPRTEG